MLTGGGYAGKKGYLEPIDYKTVTEKLDKAVELEHVVGAVEGDLPGNKII